MRWDASSLTVAVVLGAASTTRADEPVTVSVRGESVPSWSSSVDDASAPREPIDATSIVADLPSVHVRRLGSEGSFSQISVRGSASSEVGAVIAGIPITSAADPSVDVGSLPLWPGASYRVYRGFAPAALGTTGYLGGVLAIETPRATEGERTSWWTSAGSFGSLAVRAGDARWIGPVMIAGGVYASRSDGDFTFVTPNQRTGALEPHVRENAGHKAIGAIERVELGRSWGTIGALVLVDGKVAGVPGTVDFPARYASLASSRALGGVDATIDIGDATVARFAAWVRRETSSISDPRRELDRGGRAETSNRIVATGGSALLRSTPWSWIPLDLSFLADARVETFEPFPSASRAAGGVGSEVEYRPLQRLSFNGSGRIDARRDSGSSGAHDVAPSGHSGVTIDFDRAAIMAVHAGALERPPSFLELYGNGGTLIGAPTLDPERALSIDTGVRGTVGSRTKLSYEAVGFITSATGLITFVPYGRNTFRATNVDRALLIGLELTASLTSRLTRSEISYTLLSARNESDDQRQRGRPLPGRPAHDFSYDALIEAGPLELRYSLDAIAGTTVDTTGDIVFPARVFHGVGASIDFPYPKGLRASVSVDNLFDLRALPVASPLLGSVMVPVSDFIGYPLPGRSFHFTMRFDSRPASRTKARW